MRPLASIFQHRRLEAIIPPINFYMINGMAAQVGAWPISIIRQVVRTQSPSRAGLQLSVLEPALAMEIGIMLCWFPAPAQRKFMSTVCLIHRLPTRQMFALPLRFLKSEDFLGVADIILTEITAIFSSYSRDLDQLEVFQNFRALADRFRDHPLTGVIKDGLVLQLDAANAKDKLRGNDDGTCTNTTWPDLSGQRQRRHSHELLFLRCHFWLEWRWFGGGSL